MQKQLIYYLLIILNFILFFVLLGMFACIYKYYFFINRIISFSLYLLFYIFYDILYKKINNLVYGGVK